MEIVFQQDIDLELVADLLAVGMKRKPSTTRDKSRFHVTNLLESAKQITKGDVSYHEFQGAPSGIMSMGRIWESAVDCYLANYAVIGNGLYIPDQEIERDDIIASLDGIMWIPSIGWMVCETKLRFTTNDEIPMRHTQQVKAYCHLAETDLVCYVSGHLSSAPPTAKAIMRVIRLSKQSIDEVWEMLVKTKEYLVLNGKAPWMLTDEPFPNQDLVSLQRGGDSV